MEKIFHKHFASVMQDALAVFRLNNARVTVSTICKSKGVNISRSQFYSVQKGKVKNTVAYSRLMNFYISHIPSEESTRLLVAYAMALISEDLESTIERSA